MDEKIEITCDIYIDSDEPVFRASRSSGPGGQKVNKVNTRITLFFDVKNSRSLSDEQKRHILRKLSSRIDKDGFLRISAQKYRTQKANRRAAIEKFQKLLANAMQIKPIRKKTKVPYSAKQKRLEEKRKHSLKKQLRTEKNMEND